MLQRNKQAPEIERLSRKDFIIDTDMYKKLEREGLGKIVAVREGIRKETIRMRILRDRTLEATRDMMNVTGQTIVGVKDDSLSVRNFPLQKQQDSGWKLKKVGSPVVVADDGQPGTCCAVKRLKWLTPSLLPPDRWHPSRPCCRPSPSGRLR